MRSQIGVAAEASYGSYQAPTRHLEFVNETLNRNKRTIQSEGIRAHEGRRAPRSNRRVVVGRDGSGRVTFEVAYTGFGLFFEHMLGDVATSQPAGATDAYEHLFTIGSLWDKSLTVQKGVERDDETVVPYTFVGCKVPTWELNCGVDEFLRLAVDLDARDVLTGQALASATFDDGNLAHFMQASLEVDGEPLAQVTRAQITGTNPMANERYYLGSGGLKNQQKTNADPTYGGQLDADFVDEQTLVEAYHTDQPLELVLGFRGDEIETGFDEEIVITLSDIRLDGETPKVQGQGQLPTLTIPFTGFDDNGASLEILLRTTDATP